jgi:hypothetical protein
LEQGGPQKVKDKSRKQCLNSAADSHHLTPDFVIPAYCVEEQKRSFPEALPPDETELEPNARRQLRVSGRRQSICGYAKEVIRWRYRRNSPCVPIEGIQHFVLELKIYSLSDVGIFDNTDIFIFEAVHANRAGYACDIAQLIGATVASCVGIYKGTVQGITADVKVEE